MMCNSTTLSERAPELPPCSFSWVICHARGRAMRALKQLHAEEVRCLAGGPVSKPSWLAVAPPAPTKSSDELQP